MCSVVPGTLDLTSCQACKGKAHTAAVGGKQCRTQDAGCWHTACVLLCLLPKCAAAPALPMWLALTWSTAAPVLVSWWCTSPVAGSARKPRTQHILHPGEQPRGWQPQKRSAPPHSRPTIPTGSSLCAVWAAGAAAPTPVPMPAPVPAELWAGLHRGLEWGKGCTARLGEPNDGAEDGGSRGRWRQACIAATLPSSPLLRLLKLPTLLSPPGAKPCPALVLTGGSGAVVLLALVRRALHVACGVVNGGEAGALQRARKLKQGPLASALPTQPAARQQKHSRHRGASRCDLFTVIPTRSRVRWALAACVPSHTPSRLQCHGPIVPPPLQALPTVTPALLAPAQGQLPRLTMTSQEKAMPAGACSPIHMQSCSIKQVP